VVWALCPQRKHLGTSALGCGGPCGERLGRRRSRWWGDQAANFAPRGEQVQGLPQHRAVSEGDRAFFVYGFPKSDLGNIRDGEQEQFKKAAKWILALSDEQIRQLIENGQFEEVKKDG
jgi:hypothetical protein